MYKRQGGNQLTSLDVSQNTSLETLYCVGNQLTSLDVSQNTSLEALYCVDNYLTSLDVSQNTALIELDCGFNQLTSLDISQNTALTELWFGFNQLTSIDVSQNISLNDLNCMNNQLTSLDLRNGTYFSYLKTVNNDSLFCISVDDSTWYANNLTNIDSHTNFSNDCNPSTVDIIEIEKNLSVYPNPTNEEITISINNFNGNIQTEVYDLIGNRLQTTDETTISLRGYSEGIYVLKVAYGDRVEEVKVIKD